MKSKIIPYKKLEETADSQELPDDVAKYVNDTLIDGARALSPEVNIFLGIDKCPPKYKRGIVAALRAEGYKVKASLSMIKVKLEFNRKYY